MVNGTSRSLSISVALALLGCLAGCTDSGHSLGNSLDHGSGGIRSAATGGTSGSGGVSGTQPAGGHTGTGGDDTPAVGGNLATGGLMNTAGTSAVAGQGGTRTGGASGTGGQGGTTTPIDAGSGGDAAPPSCAYRGESCATRSCCGPLVCQSLGGASTCYESTPPPADSGVTADGARPLDAACPVCPAMKCTYGSPVDSNGCTSCQCNPPPDGGVDAPVGCALPEGCPDAEPGSPCPSTPPTQGSTCTGQTVCSYEDCPGSGHTQASCRSGQWTVSTGACGTVYCQGVNTVVPCPSGQVCLVQAGGALLASCIDNPCASGLVSADCSSVTAGCTPIFSTTSGLTYYCNTCAAPPCA